MANGQIESSSTRPFGQSCSATNVISGFACKLSATMTANHNGRKTGSLGQRNRLRIIAGSNLDLVTALLELRNQRAEKRHVRRVCKIDPKVHSTQVKRKK